ncbi:MAG: FtsW/RodA/SpoVE family cell cycle protein [Clostridiales bacterium]|nr:MAG: FtsW/RodA/SpoVE family cell cycle protein [Clostridiales bacterium]
MKRQMFFAVFGLIIMYAVSRSDLDWAKRIALPLLGITVVLLVLVLIVGEDIKGAKRWLKLGPISFQPSEIAKYCVIIFLWQKKHIGA